MEIRFLAVAILVKCLVGAEGYVFTCRQLSCSADVVVQVASKIREGTAFHAFIVIPMWPEGIADAAITQELRGAQIIHKQFQSLATPNRGTK
eukprot:1787535-Amphidinium_carterae.1